jgi:hypothetical protein
METTNSVDFRVPDFLGQDGVEYTDIEIAILSDDGDIQDAVRLAERWSVHGAPTMTEKKLGPSDFRGEVERLRAAGTLPTLEEVLDAVADVRKKNAPKILTLGQASRPV